MNEFLRQFLVESRELALQATAGLLRLEQTPHDSECLDEVFRALHTLKGGAGIVEFAAMESRVHAAEELLSEVRAAKRVLTAGVVGECLECLEQVLTWLDALEQSGELPAVSAAPPLAGSPGRPIGQLSGAPAGATPAWMTGLLERTQSLRSRARCAIQFIPDPDCFYQGDDPIAQLSALPQLLALEVRAATPWPPLDAFDPSVCNLVLTALAGCSAEQAGVQLQAQRDFCEILPVDSAASAEPRDSFSPLVRDLLDAQCALLANEKPHGFAGRLASAGVTAANVMRFCGRNDLAQVMTRATEASLAENSADPLREAIERALAPAVAAPPLPAAGSPARADAAGRTLRVDAQRIDSLVRLSGELTVVKNAIGHTALLAQAQSNTLANAMQRQHGTLERLIGELQNAVVSLRVLPLRSVFQRFPRVVREMALSLGKPVQLEFEGEQTEADKSIVEMLFEPLLHVVRNALDHGVEAAPVRLRRGKNPIATIRVRAAREGNQVRIEVADDGGGIDVERVREVAGHRNLAAPEELRSLTDAQVIDLIFAPGFSTAATVTELSGRGVGMDAVRTAVERVGGRVSIDTRAAHGTTVSFAMPFSILMTDVMTVEAGGQVFGVPLDAVIETLRLPPAAFAGIGAARVFTHRNRTIPVLELAELLGFPAAARGEQLTDATVVVAGVAGQLVGIQVDRPGERMQVMLKPLQGLLAGAPAIAGTTLLGDGRVLLVLDIAEILQ